MDSDSDGALSLQELLDGFDKKQDLLVNHHDERTSHHMRGPSRTPPSSALLDAPKLSRNSL